MNRFVTEGDGYTTWHCFSSGAHYDPDRVAWGPLIALDEHLVAPGGGFDWHPHRGVRIASWVLEGTLHHEDSAGTDLVHGPGTFLVQSVGEGIRHRETNASPSIPLRMVQLVILADGPYSVRSVAAPADLGEIVVDHVVGGRHVGAAVFDLDHGTFCPDGGEAHGPALLLHRNAVSENRR